MHVRLAGSGVILFVSQLVVPKVTLLVANSAVLWCMRVVVTAQVLGFSGRDLVQASVAKNEEKVCLLAFSVPINITCHPHPTSQQIQVERLSRLFLSAHWVVKCFLAKDENSFIEELSFVTLDVCLPFT